VKAGLDLEMPSSGGVNDRKVMQAVLTGRLDEKYVDLACERILNINYRYLENAKPETPWNKEADHELAAQIASECMVLLKNEEDLLPLSKEDQIAFIGEFAAKPRFQGGGSSHINCFKTTSAVEAAQGLKVTYTQGYSVARDEATDEMIAEAVAAAKNAKAAVIFAGLPDSYESEGYDRTHMKMPACQNKLIEAVAEANPNTVVVLHNGSPVELPWLSKVKAVLEAYLGGQAVGLATVRVLFGDVNPSGHLAETFPIKLSDNPSYLFYGGEKNDTDYREGIFVGYRYYDRKEMAVQFPFGHGLSYTKFEYSDLWLDKSEITDEETVTATVTVKNVGNRTGKTVVQLYVSDLVSTPIRPVRELKGFEKVELRPGETKQVTFTLDKRSFAYWNQQLGDWHVETGEFAIEVGQSSRDICLTETVRVNSTVAIPVKYTMDSIVLDIMDDPQAAEAMKPLMQAIKDTLMPEDGSEAASEAITEDMSMAMLKYMPLRGILSFGGGNMELSGFQQLLGIPAEEE
jgi:beta-glucosidase